MNDTVLISRLEMRNHLFMILFSTKIDFKYIK